MQVMRRGHNHGLHLRVVEQVVEIRGTWDAIGLLVGTGDLLDHIHPCYHLRVLGLCENLACRLVRNLSKADEAESQFTGHVIPPLAVRDQRSETRDQ